MQPSASIQYPNYAYSITQNDCAVQSTPAIGPETRHVETQMEDFDFEEIWCHIETQTTEPFGNDALTQTVHEFMDSGSITDHPYNAWGNSP